jgi:hypothetical protein
MHPAPFVPVIEPCDGQLDDHFMTADRTEFSAPGHGLVAGGKRTRPAFRAWMAGQPAPSGMTPACAAPDATPSDRAEHSFPSAHARANALQSSTRAGKPRRK